MKHRLYLLGISLVVLLAVSLSAYAQPFVIPITVTDDSALIRNIGFGYLYGANAGIDTADHYLTFAEFEQPPFPPTGNIHVAFKDPDLTVPDTLSTYGQGSLADFRPAIAPGGVKDSFYVKLQPGGAGYPLHLTWPGSLNAHATEMRIVDVVTKGLLFSVDMLTTTTFDIPSPHEGFYIYCTPIIAPPISPYFYSLTPVKLFNEDPIKIGKPQKLAKRFKGFYPNVSNLIEEVCAQGGFQPGTSESDLAGGMVVGISYMDNIGGKWKPNKASAALYNWHRMSAWNAAKGVGKGGSAIQKPLKDKTGMHTNIPRGLDSTGNPGDLKRKHLVKQGKGLFPKKVNNLLFAELVALKVNIAASALGKTPVGFGELLYNDAGHPFDQWAVKRISEHLDSMMTHWEPYSPPIMPDYSAYILADSAITRINRAFVQPLDTVSWEAGGKGFATLVVKSNVMLSTTPYLVLPTEFVPTRVQPTNTLEESEEDFESFDPEDADGVPVAMTVMNNFPNPFNPTTTLAFHIANDANVTITVYDMLGREVGLLADREAFDAGVNTVEFDASGLASGVYFYRVSAQDVETGAQIAPITGKMMLLK